MHVRTISYIFATVVLAASTSFVPARAASVPMHLRGTLVSATAKHLAVRTASGILGVALTPKTGYAGAVHGSLADIKPGTFVGIASAQSGGTSQALEVTVFPESMRGRGEGDYPWDLGPRSARSAMTNGTVAAHGPAASHAMMTNGSVSGRGASGASLTVRYKGGSRRIDLPPNMAIVRLVPGSSAILATGAHVFVVAKKAAGDPVAAFVVVGQGGAVPPM